MIVLTIDKTSITQFLFETLIFSANPKTKPSWICPFWQTVGIAALCCHTWTALVQGPSPVFTKGILKINSHTRYFIHAKFGCVQHVAQNPPSVGILATQMLCQFWVLPMNIQKKTKQDKLLVVNNVQLWTALWLLGKLCAVESKGV